MDKQALGMAIFMGLYVPLFTGISVKIHRLIRQTSQHNNKIIVVYRQFKSQYFEDINNNQSLKNDKLHSLPLAKDISDIQKLKFYQYLPLAYRRNENLVQNFDPNNIVIVESKTNLSSLSQQSDR